MLPTEVTDWPRTEEVVPQLFTQRVFGTRLEPDMIWCCIECNVCCMLNFCIFNSHCSIEICIHTVLQ